MKKEYEKPLTCRLDLSLVLTTDPGTQAPDSLTTGGSTEYGDTPEYEE